jgi:ketosteroid isomerase-like protein
MVELEDRLRRLEATTDRLDSMNSIREITARYAILLDARDLDGLVELFIDDVRASPTAERGRGPLRAHYEHLCRGWGYTIHQVYQQAIDFETSDKAMGHVYCKAEHVIDGKFVVAALRYLDRYERRDGRWYFRWRRTPMWYVTHQADGPVSDDRINWPNRENGRPELPDSMETYRRFYDMPTSS